MLINMIFFPLFAILIYLANSDSNNGNLHHLTIKGLCNAKEHCR